MKENKNILKGNKQAEQKVVRDKSFYAIVEYNVKSEKDGSTSKKTIVLETTGTRMEAKNELIAEAKSLGGTVTYFGGFVN